MQLPYVQPQYPYRHQHASPPQGRGPPPSLSAQAAHSYHSPYSTRYPSPRVWSPGHIKQGTSPTYDQERPPLLYTMSSSPYNQMRLEGIQTRRPAVIVHQNSLISAERYPPTLGDSSRDWYSKGLSPLFLSSSLDGEEDRGRGCVQRDRALMPLAPQASSRSSRSRSFVKVERRKGRPFDTQADGSTRNFEDPAKELNQLLGKARADRESKEEAQWKHVREYEGRSLSHEHEAKNKKLKNSERKVKVEKDSESSRARRELRAYTREYKAAIERKHQRNSSKDGMPPLTPPMVDTIKEPQLPWKECQKSTTVPPASVTKVDTSLGDTLDTKTGSRSSKRALVSIEFPRSPTSSPTSLSKTREDVSNDFELRIYPQTRPKFPILLRKTNRSPVDDGQVDDQRPQANTYHYNVSARLESDVLLSNSFPVKAPPSAGFSDGQISGLERDNRDQGENHPTKVMKKLSGAQKLANTPQPNSMGQIEPPSFTSSTLAQATESDTRDSGQSVHEAMEGPAKELVLLSKASKSNIPKTFAAVNYSLTSCLESSCDGNAEEAEGDEDRSFVEAARESDEASEECEVNLKSALDIAMNVVKNLLLRELLDYALPDATYALEGSRSSRSVGLGSSASSSPSSLTSNSQTPQRRKRLRGNGRNLGDGDGEGDDSDGDDRPKKKNEKSSADLLPQRRLKCPFYQRQPEKYKKAACKGDGFVDMAKLKDHIKRVHTQPLRCSRCWLEITSEEAYSEHLQRENICKKKTEPQEDRIRPQLLKRLDFKKAPYAHAGNVEEKWKMLFSVLFPSDTNIPSPYEQQGMSPRLERALSEALEEELTRELASIIEPIMTKIKGCIPAIIESCRQKLISASPFSDDEAVFTPSATSSGIGSSDSDLGSSMKESRHWGSPNASRCSRSSAMVVPIAEVLSNKAQGKRQHHPMPSTSNASMDGRLVASSPRNSTDYSMFYPDVPLSALDLHGNSIDNSFDNSFTIEQLYTIPGGSPRDYDPATNSSSIVSANTCEIVSGLYDLAQGLPQQDNPSPSISQLPIWPLLEDGWDHGNIIHGESRGERQDCSTLQQLLPPQQWELIMKDFSFSNSSNC